MTPAPLLRQLIVETCASLQAAVAAQPIDFLRDRMGEALVADLLDSHDPCRALVVASLYAVHCQPGMARHLAERVERVAAADADVETGHKVLDDGTHQHRCSWDVGCDACDQHWQARLDEALDKLLELLDSSARDRLVQIAAIGTGAAA